MCNMQIENGELQVSNNEKRGFLLYIGNGYMLYQTLSSSGGWTAGWRHGCASPSLRVACWQWRPPTVLPFTTPGTTEQHSPCGWARERTDCLALPPTKSESQVGHPPGPHVIISRHALSQCENIYLLYLTVLTDHTGDSKILTFAMLTDCELIAEYD